jgi:hypothetical protein
VIRAVLGTGGRPPLEAPGLEIHDKLALLDETVAAALKRHDSPLTGQLGRHIHRAVICSHDLARMVTRLHRFVKRAARILGRKKESSDKVKADFDLLLERIRVRLRQPATSPEEAKALRKMLSSAEYYGGKLFTCYDHADLPRTNNGHEHMYGRLRGNERRVTGHKSTSRTVRDGRFTAPVIERVLRRGVAAPDELARASPETCKRNLEEMRKAREQHARARLIRENYDTVMEGFMLYAARLRRRPSNRASLLDTVILRR